MGRQQHNLCICLATPAQYWQEIGYMVRKMGRPPSELLLGLLEAAAICCTAAITTSSLQVLHAYWMQELVKLPVVFDMPMLQASTLTNSGNAEILKVITRQAIALKQPLQTNTSRGGKNCEATAPL